MIPFLLEEMEFIAIHFSLVLAIVVYYFCVIVEGVSTQWAKLPKKQREASRVFVQSFQA